MRCKNKLFILFLFPLFLWGDSSLVEFDRLMGKKNTSFDALSFKEQAFLEKLKQHYEQKKERIKAEALETKIPKVIHFIWLGPRPFPPTSVQNVRSWLAKHPDWKIKFWTDRSRFPPCEEMECIDVEAFSFSFFGELFNQTENYGEKSDLLRFEILYREGGVYVDHDASCLTSFDALHEGFDFYCGLEVPHPPVADRVLTCGNGLIGAKPSHPLIKEVIHLIAARWEEIAKRYRGNDGYSRTQRVMERTYLALTLAIEKNLDRLSDCDIVLPAAYFFSKGKLAPLYSQHFFANAWAQEKRKSVPKQWRKEIASVEKMVKKIQKMVLLTTLCNTVALFFLIKKPRQFFR